jgi:hypothetical protein
MKRYFQQEKSEHSTGAASLTAEIVSALAMLGLSYIVMPAVIGTGSNLLKSAYGLVRSEPEMHEKFSTATDYGKTSSGDGIARASSGPRLASRDQALLPASYVSAATVDPADISAAVSLSTPDRHWRMAQAFNAALDRARLDVPLQQIPAASIK